MSAQQDPQLGTPAPASAAPVPAPAAEPVTPPEPAQETVEQMFPAAYVKQLRDEAASTRVKLKEFEDAQKTELQRATDDAEAARKEAAEARTREARFRVAIAHSIPEEHLEFLTGTTEADLEAQATKLSALVNPQGTADLKPPLVPASAGGITPPPNVVPIQDMIVAAEASGDKALVAALKAQQLGSK